MPGYRLYCLNKTVSIVSVNTVECDADVDALGHAQAMLSEQGPCFGVEIWEGARKVARLPDGTGD